MAGYGAITHECFEGVKDAVALDGDGFHEAEQVVDASRKLVAREFDIRKVAERWRQVLLP